MFVLKHIFRALFHRRKAPFRKENFAGIECTNFEIASFLWSSVAHSCTRFPCYLGMEIYAINAETQ